MFYDRYLALCKERGLKPNQAAVQIGLNKGSISYWKRQWQLGKEALPDSVNAQRIADFFGVSVDYLLGRTDDPTNYDDGDILAQIPLSYVEAADGDMKRARAIMLAAERDAQMEAQEQAKSARRFSKRDSDLIFALWGDTADIDEQDVEDVRKFADFIKERKRKK